MTDSHARDPLDKWNSSSQINRFIPETWRQCREFEECPEVIQQQALRLLCTSSEKTTPGIVAQPATRKNNSTSTSHPSQTCSSSLLGTIQQMSRNISPYNWRHAWHQTLDLSDDSERQRLSLLPEIVSQPWTVLCLVKRQQVTRWIFYQIFGSGKVSPFRKVHSQLQITQLQKQEPQEKLLEESMSRSNNCTWDISRSKTNDETGIMYETHLDAHERNNGCLIHCCE